MQRHWAGWAKLSLAEFGKELFDEYRIRTFKKDKLFYNITFAATYRHLEIENLFQLFFKRQSKGLK